MRAVARFAVVPRRQDARVLANLNNSALLTYLSSQAQGQGSATATATASTGGKAPAVTVPKAALDRAAGTAKMATAARSLDTAQKALSGELRAALAKAGVKLTGAVEFVVKSDGKVETKGSDADKAAIKAFLTSDARQPSFASRIASQARDALKLSASVQQSAAISQAAQLGKGAGGVMSLYTTLMQNTGTTSVVFSLSATSSSLTYPGSLSANA